MVTCCLIDVHTDVSLLCYPILSSMLRLLQKCRDCMVMDACNS